MMPDAETNRGIVFDQSLEFRSNNKVLKHLHYFAVCFLSSFSLFIL